MEDEFLFCERLDTRTTAKDIFNKVDRFFEEHDIQWKHVIGVCTDGAPAMLGCRSGFQTLVKEKSPNVVGTHCIIHRQALMVKTMPDELSHVLDKLIKTVNFIKANALNSRLFAELCKESDSVFENLLLHTRVRWQSKGKVLKRIFVLRKDTHEFLRDVKPDMHKNFSDDHFLMFLSFLVDIFESVNSVNLALQDKEVNVLHCHEKFKAFNMKLSLWHSKLNKKNFASFPYLNEFLDGNELQMSDVILEVMKLHVSILSEEISRYFPNLQESDKLYRFINFPFGLKLDNLPSSNNQIQEQFIDMANDGSAKNVHREMCCSDFWIAMAQTYPDLAKMALKVLIPFATTYECEAAFSTLLHIKTKYRNRLDVTNDMRVALCKTSPKIDELIAVKQVHPSH